MKIHPQFVQMVVEATDEYYNEVHAKWLPVPAFWVGQFVNHFTHKIRSRV